MLINELYVHYTCTFTVLMWQGIVCIYSKASYLYNVGSFSKINKSDQSQAALPVSQSPSALATNMGALHVHQTAHIVEKSDAATQVMPSDQSAVEFDSVVPAIFLPLSKVGLYLPEGKILADIDASIPLPYKAMLVLKNQTAAIVFGYNESDKTENYGGKTLGKKAEVLMSG